jgi:peptidoglycan/LPS O-acetylase OafA/YrhL
MVTEAVAGVTRVAGRVQQVRHRVGVDGLRALAVTAVLAFHLHRLPGGNLGVDAFFVISGWLITWRLLHELDTTGAIDLRGFWAGRFRRLLPASLVVLGAIAVVWPIAGIDVPSLRRDLVFALGWASNWGTITGGGDYWARFGEASPVVHFWSLAIEEQFYLVWPLVLVGCAAIARRRDVTTRHVVALVAAAGTVASVAFMWSSFDATDPSATYLNTFARAHALLIGVLAAVVTAPSVHDAARLRGGRAARRLLPVATAIAAGVVVAVSVRPDDTEWLYRGGFVAFAVAVAVIVVAVADDAGVSWLGARPMRWLGTRSYGLYLWHWPVFLFVDAAGAPTSGGAGVGADVVKVVVAMAFAEASFRCVEEPVRRRRVLAGWRAPVAGAGLATAVAVAAVVVVHDRAPSTATVVELAPVVAAAGPVPTPAVLAGNAERTESAAPARGADAATSAMSLLASLPASGLVVESGPRRVLVAGDSTGVHLADAAMRYATANPSDLVVGSAAFPGCGLSADDDGRRHRFTDDDGAQETIDLGACVSQWASVPMRVGSAEAIDVVVVSVGPWDGTDIELADGRVVSVLDPVGRSLVLARYRQFASSIRAAGGDVVWVRPPDIDLRWDDVDSPLDDPRRWSALRGVVDELADTLSITTVDLPGWLVRTGNDGPTGRPDGVHLDPVTADAFVVDELAPALSR